MEYFRAFFFMETLLKSCVSFTALMKREKCVSVAVIFYNKFKAIPTNLNKWNQIFNAFGKMP